ncbi:hypothetical protein QUF80_22660 [Desulfococcaceae bacterium HSG8]|nr:hypothetical protein [Desulfococcaceae bacterium HSG8]
MLTGATHGTADTVKFLLLDEPCQGLDPSSRRMISDMEDFSTNPSSVCDTPSPGNHYHVLQLGVIRRIPKNWERVNGSLRGSASCFRLKPVS